MIKPNPERFDFSFGDPVVVRRALVESLPYQNTTLPENYMAFGYPPHAGLPDLLDVASQLTHRQTGRVPKYVIITNGATGAVNAALYGLKAWGTKYVAVDARHFSFYPQMILQSGLTMRLKPSLELTAEAGRGPKVGEIIRLDASPSNPDGTITTDQAFDIWDGAYAARQYGFDHEIHAPKSWRVFCGSFGKTLGLTGLRLGWAATDDERVYSRMLRHVEASSLGVSIQAQRTALEIMGRIDLDRFELTAEAYLSANFRAARVLGATLGIKFNRGHSGMFATFKLTERQKLAFIRAGVVGLPGSKWGETDDWIRLSLGQENELTTEAFHRLDLELQK